MKSNQEEKSKCRYCDSTKDCCFCHPESYGWNCPCKCHTPQDTKEEQLEYVEPSENKGDTISAKDYFSPQPEVKDWELKFDKWWKSKEIMNNFMEQCTISDFENMSELIKSFIFQTRQEAIEETKLEMDKALTDLLQRFANTPLAERSNGWDWIIQCRNIIREL